MSPSSLENFIDTLGNSHMPSSSFLLPSHSFLPWARSFPCGSSTLSHGEMKHTGIGRCLFHQVGERVVTESPQHTLHDTTLIFLSRNHEMCGGRQDALPGTGCSGGQLVPDATANFLAE